MSANSERVFVTGATGHIGTRLVQQLVKKGVQTTIYVRSETKAKDLFGEELKSGLLTTVIGDYSSLDKYEKSIQGHTRLFILLVADFQKAASMPELKRDLAKIAYNQGVRQIVDLSSVAPRLYGKQGILGYIHEASEQYLWNLAEENSEQRSLVILRPAFFMTNHFMADVHLIKKANKIVSCGSPTAMLSWIDTKDIADCAAVILTDPINKHDRLVYEMGGEIVNNEQRAALFTKILGRPIPYEQVSPVEFYNMYTSHHIPHSLAYDLASYGIDDGGQIETPQLSILINRPLTTLEEWIKENVEQFK